MKTILKSAALGVAGTGLFFFFLVSVTVPAMALLWRMRYATNAASAVIDPSLFLRHVGLPLSAAVFATAFALALRRFRRLEREAAAAHLVPDRGSAARQRVGR